MATIYKSSTKFPGMEFIVKSSVGNTVTLLPKHGSNTGAEVSITVDEFEHDFFSTEDLKSSTFNP